jgi:hypothetical protein
MDRTELDTMYMRVPHAGRELGVDSNMIYRMCQRGVLDSLLEGGRWYVSRQSVAAEKRKRPST